MQPRTTCPRSAIAGLIWRRFNLVESPVVMASYGDSLDAGGPVGRSGFAPAAARVGADLRAARERLGWTLPSIAAHLRIRLPYLEAIEDGRISDLPGNAYAVGFVRTYAQTLGLDPDEVARRFRAEAAEVNRKTELDFPAPVPERGVPALAVIAVGVVLAIGAYIGWYRMSGNDRPTNDTVQQVPDRLAPLADKPPAKVADASPDASGTAIVSEAPATSAPDAPAATPATVQPASLPANPAILPPVAAAALPTVGAPSDSPRVMLRAKAEAWVQVRDKQTGQVLLNRVLKPGETWPVPPRPLPLLLTAGNPGGTEVLVDGVVAPPIGIAGRVLHDLPLDPDALKLGKVAANTPATPPPTLRQPPHNP